jgi:iron complex transport system substrate-binding protein
VLVRIALALVLAAAVAGCQESGFDESRETQRPLKVQHAMDPLTGTRVPGVAERPLTLTADTLGDAAALGVQPVAAALPGGQVPGYLGSAARGVELVPATDVAAMEAADPDVILGSKEANGDLYPELRTIAPTVMGEGTDWKLNLRLHGEALGRTNDAEALLIDWDNRVAKVRKAVGERDVSVVLVSGAGREPVDPDSFAGGILAEVGVRSGPGGVEQIRMRDRPEWKGGGVLAARAVLADLTHAL